VDELSGAHLRLFSAPVAAGGADPGLGLNQEEMGMGVDIAQLESAADVDRTFIAAMIDHHAGAVRMAEVELRRGSDQAVKDMARRIMSQGSREVERLKAWQNSWYGSRSTPGGGRPRGDGG